MLIQAIKMDENFNLIEGNAIADSKTQRSFANASQQKNSRMPASRICGKHSGQSFGFGGVND